MRTQVELEPKNGILISEGVNGFVVAFDGNFWAFDRKDTDVMLQHITMLVKNREQVENVRRARRSSSRRRRRRASMIDDIAAELEISPDDYRRYLKHCIKEVNDLRESEAWKGDTDA